jgi:hypothetical protein
VQPAGLFFFGFTISEQAAGLQTYASNWNSMQAYASKSPTAWGLSAGQNYANACDSLQTYASSSANLWVK